MGSVGFKASAAMYSEAIFLLTTYFVSTVVNGSVRMFVDFFK